MGGRLCVESNVGDGSRFYFTLQLPPATVDIPYQGTFTSSAVKLSPGEKVSALVVDDIYDNRELLSTILENLGVDVVQAQDGESAIESATHHLPNIIFMDYCMPGMNGIEAMREIRRIHPNVKVVIVTASALEQEMQTVRESSCNMAIKKPFRIEEIVGSLANLLNVKFEYSEESNNLDFTGNAVKITSRLPEELHVKLMEAAELCVVSDLNDLLEQVKESTEQGESLARRLKLLIENYDMDGIIQLLDTLHHEHENI